MRIGRESIHYFQTVAEIVDICSKYDDVFLCGAGRYGKVYKWILELNSISITGFLVSRKTVSTYLDLPVFEINEVEIKSNTCIILSLSHNLYNEVVKSFNYRCEVYCVRKENQLLFTCSPYLSFLKQYGIKHNSCGLSLSGRGNFLIVQIEQTYGDIVWSTAFLRELRLNFPTSKITYVVNRKMMSLLSCCPYIDEVMPYDLGQKVGYINPMDLYTQVRAFCENFTQCFEAVFLPRLLPFSFDEIWDNVFISQCVKTRLIYAHADFDVYSKKILEEFEPYFSKIVKHTFGEHEVIRKLSLLRACGGSIANDYMELWINSKADNYARNLLNVKGGKAFIIVGLVGSNPVRSWPANKYNDLFRKIRMKKEVTFVLCGGEDAVESALIAKRGNEEFCIDITGKTTLLQVAAIIKYCNIYIGSDTGLMHMASAFNKPIVEISCSLPGAPSTCALHPVRTGPWRVPNFVLRPPYALGKCKFVCLGKNAHCICLIEVKEVLKFAIFLMNKYIN